MTMAELAQAIAAKHGFTCIRIMGDMTYTRRRYKFNNNNRLEVHDDGRWHIYNNPTKTITHIGTWEVTFK